MKVPKYPTKGPEQHDTPFDIWLNRGLHQLFDEIAREPLPEELLKLIEQDHEK